MLIIVFPEEFVNEDFLILSTFHTLANVDINFISKLGESRCLHSE